MALIKLNNRSSEDDAIHGRRNLIINGAMRIAQRGSSSITLGTSAEVFRADRFRIEQGGATANNGTTEISNDVPSGQGFSSSLKITAGSSNSYNSGGYSALNYRGEGRDIPQVLHGTSSAKSVTLSFWVKSSVTGVYSLNHTKYDGSLERWYVSEYTINSANTWEYKTITISGDTSYTASEWFRLYWHLGGDSAAENATTGSWFNGDGTKRATSNQPNMIGTNGATFFITGVQLEVGDIATPFEHLSYGEELMLCEKYFQKSKNAVPVQNNFGGHQIHVASGQDPQSVIPLRPQMRTSPSVTLYSAHGSGTSGQWYGAAFNNGFSANARAFGESARSFIIDNTDVGASTNGWCEIGWTADAEL